MDHYDIFISYSRKDSRIVDDVVSKLKQHGFSVWLDKNGIESGDAFKRVIVKAIEKSKCVLFFSSIDSNLSKWTAKEIGVAVYENKYIIPVLIDKSKYNPEVKFDLINLDYIDFTDSSSRSEMFVKLIKTLSIKCDKIVGNNTEGNETSASKLSNAHWHKIPTNYWRSFLADLKKRNALVNFILIAIQLLGILSLIPGISGTLWSISLLDSPEWSFSKIYGKGFIPGLLMSISIIISNGFTLRWSRKGVYLLFILFVLIFIPTIWNEFEEYVYFSVFAMLGIFTYWGVLLIPYKEISTWKRCNPNTNSLSYLSIVALVIWGVTLVFLPPIMAKATGFKDNLYKNGIIAIDARCHGGAFYLRRLANRMAFYQNESDSYNADKWYKKAIFESERDYSDDRGYYSKDCYIDYIYFLVKNGKKTNAIEYLQEAIHKFGVDSVLKEIKDDSYEYNRSPYRATILDYLSEVKE